MFISTVLSRPESLPRYQQPLPPAATATAATATAGAAATAGGGASEPVGGLWSHPKRFNVAITRRWVGPWG
mgnify:CR=1 FL=1